MYVSPVCGRYASAWPSSSDFSNVLAAGLEVKQLKLEMALHYGMTASQIAVN